MQRKNLKFVNKIDELLTKIENCLKNKEQEIIIDYEEREPITLSSEDFKIGNIKGVGFFKNFEFEEDIRKVLNKYKEKLEKIIEES